MRKSHQTSTMRSARSPPPLTKHEEEKTQLQALPSPLSPSRAQSAIFALSPSHIHVRGYAPHSPVTRSFTLTNHNATSQFVTVDRPDDHHFTIKQSHSNNSANSDGSSKIAPGMSCYYTLTFTPTVADIDYQCRVRIVTEHDIQWLTVLCQPTPLTVEAPSFVQCATTAIYDESVKPFAIRNTSTTPVAYQLTVSDGDSGRWSVMPSSGTLSVDETIQCCLHYRPTTVSQHDTAIIAVAIHSIGDSARNISEYSVKVLGSSHSLENAIFLSQSSLSMPNTYMGLSSQSLVTLFNHSTIPVTYQWSNYETKEQIESQRHADRQSIDDSEHNDRLMIEAARTEEKTSVADSESDSGELAYIKAMNDCHRKYKRLRDELSQRHYHYHSQNFEMSPLSGMIFPSGQMEFTVRFSPSYCSEFSDRAYLHITGLSLPLSLAMKGTGHGPTLAFEPSSHIDLGVIRMRECIGFTVKLSNQGLIPAQWSFNEHSERGEWSMTPVTGLLGIKPEWREQQRREKQMMKVLSDESVSENVDDSECNVLTSPLLNESRLSLQDSQTLTVTFQPTHIGQLLTQLPISTEGAPSTLLTVRATIVGPSLSWERQSFDFANIGCGVEHCQPFTVNNDSDIDARCTLYFRHASYYNAERDYRCSIHYADSDVTSTAIVLKTKSSNLLTLRVCGSMIGDMSECALVCDIDGVGVANTIMPILATIIAPSFTVSPPLLSFTEVFLNHSHTRTVEVKNANNTAIRVDIECLCDSDSGSDSTSVIATESSSVVVAANSTLSVPFTVTAPLAGAATGRLAFHSHGSRSLPIIVPFSYHCIGPRVSITANKVDYGKCECLTSHQRSLTLINSSPINAVIDTVFHHKHTIFALDSQSLTLAPFETRTVSVIARPSEVASVSESLSFLVRDSDALTVKLSLQGIGTSIFSSVPFSHAVTASTSSSFTFHSFPTRTKAAQLFTLENRSNKRQRLTWLPVPRLSQSKLIALRTKNVRSSSTASAAELEELSEDDRLKLEYSYAIKNRDGDGGRDGDSQSVFAISPSTLSLDSHHAMTFALTGESSLSQTVSERWVCLSLTEGDRSPACIFDTLIHCHFVEPEVRFVPDNALSFNHRVKPSVGEIADFVMTDTIVINNPTPLTLRIRLDLAHTSANTEEIPLSLSISDFLLNPNQSLPVSVTFTPQWGVYQRFDTERCYKLLVAFDTHSKVQSFPINTRVQYPNIVCETVALLSSQSPSLTQSLIDFGCVESLVHTRSVHQFINNGSMPVRYQWKMTRRPKTTFTCGLSDSKRKVVLSNDSELAANGLSDFDSAALFEISPTSGVIEPGQSQSMEFLYHSPSLPQSLATMTSSNIVNQCLAFQGMVQCEVDGGPVYPMTLSAGTSQLSYSINRQSLNFGFQSLNSDVSQSFTLSNTGAVSFTFHTSIANNDLGLYSVTPTTGTLSTNEKRKMTITFSAKLPEVIEAMLVINIAYLEPLTIPLCGSACYASTYCDLPRLTSSASYEKCLSKAKALIEQDAATEANEERDRVIAALDLGPSNRNISSSGRLSPRYNHRPNSPSMRFQQQQQHTPRSSCSGNSIQLSMASTSMIAANTGIQSMTPPELPLSFLQCNPEAPLYIEADRIYYANQLAERKFSVAKDFSLSHYMVDFGSLTKGSVIERTFSITNTSPFITAVNIETSAFNNTPFTLSPSAVSSLKPAETVKLTLTCLGQVPMKGKKVKCGTVSGDEGYSVSVPVTLRYGPPLTLSVQCQLHVPILSLSSQALAFNSIHLGQRKELYVKLTNSQPIPAAYHWSVPVSQLPSPPPQSPFAVYPSTGELSPGQSVLVLVSFTPNTEASFKYKFHCKVSSASGAMVGGYNSSLSLMVTGQSQASKLSIDPSSLSLSPMLPHSHSPPQSITLRNDSDHPLELFCVEFDRQWQQEQRMMGEDEGWQQAAGSGIMLVDVRQAGQGLPVSVLQRYRERQQRLANSSSNPDAANDSQLLVSPLPFHSGLPVLSSACLPPSSEVPSVMNVWLLSPPSMRVSSLATSLSSRLSLPSSAIISSIDNVVSFYLSLDHRLHAEEQRYHRELDEREKKLQDIQKRKEKIKKKDEEVTLLEEEDKERKRVIERIEICSDEEKVLSRQVKEIVEAYRVSRPQLLASPKSVTTTTIIADNPVLTSPKTKGKTQTQELPASVEPVTAPVFSIDSLPLPSNDSEPLIPLELFAKLLHTYLLRTDYVSGFILASSYGRLLSFSDSVSLIVSVLNSLSVERDNRTYVVMLDQSRQTFDSDSVDEELKLTHELESLRAINDSKDAKDRIKKAKPAASTPTAASQSASVVVNDSDNQIKTLEARLAQLKADRELAQQYYDTSAQWVTALGYAVEGMPTIGDMPQSDEELHYRATLAERERQAALQAEEERKQREELLRLSTERAGKNGKRNSIAVPPSAATLAAINSTLSSTISEDSDSEEMTAEPLVPPPVTRVVPSSHSKYCFLNLQRLDFNVSDGRLVEAMGANIGSEPFSLNRPSSLPSFDSFDTVSHSQALPAPMLYDVQLPPSRVAAFDTLSTTDPRGSWRIDGVSQYRWLLPAHSTLPLSLSYHSLSRLGVFETSLTFCSTDARPASVTVPLNAIVTVPTVTLELKKEKKEKSKIRNKRWNKKERRFEFGALRVGHGLYTVNDSNSSSEAEYEQTMILSNTSPFDVDVDLSFVADVNSKGLSIHTAAGTNTDSDHLGVNDSKKSQAKKAAASPRRDGAKGKNDKNAPVQANEDEEYIKSLATVVDKAVFSVSDSHCRIAAGQSATFRLRAEPHSINQSLADTLQINIENNPIPILFPVHCVGALPSLTFKQAALAFAPVLLGHSHDSAAVIVNTSAFALRYELVTGDDWPRWLVIEPSLRTGTIAPLSELSILVRLVGEMTGTKSFTMSLKGFDSANQPVRMVKVSEDSEAPVDKLKVETVVYDIDVATELPPLAESSSQLWSSTVARLLSFGDIKVNEPATKTFTIEHKGAGTAQYRYAIDLPSTSPLAPFLSFEPANGIIGPKGKVAVSAKLAVNQALTVGENVDVRVQVSQVIDSDSGSAGDDESLMLTLAVSFASHYSEFTLAPEPSTLTFDPLPLMALASKTVTLTNIGKFPFRFHLYDTDPSSDNRAKVQRLKREAEAKAKLEAEAREAEAKEQAAATTKKGAKDDKAKDNKAKKGKEEKSDNESQQPVFDPALVLSLRRFTVYPRTGLIPANGSLTLEIRLTGNEAGRCDDTVEIEVEGAHRLVKRLMKNDNGKKSRLRLRQAQEKESVMQTVSVEPLSRYQLVGDVIVPAIVNSDWSAIFSNQALVGSRDTHTGTSTNMTVFALSDTALCLPPVLLDPAVIANTGGDDGAGSEDTKKKHAGKGKAKEVEPVSVCINDSQSERFTRSERINLINSQSVEAVVHLWLTPSPLPSLATPFNPSNLVATVEETRSTSESVAKKAGPKDKKVAAANEASETVTPLPQCNGFSLTQSTITIPANASIPIDILFKPTACQTYSAHFTAFTLNSLSVLSFGLHGQSCLESLSIETPAKRDSKDDDRRRNIEFQRVHVKSDDPLPATVVSIKNNGLVSAVIEAVLTDSEALSENVSDGKTSKAVNTTTSTIQSLPSVFHCDDLAQSFTVSPGQSKDFALSFRPQSTGMIGATLLVKSLSLNPQSPVTAFTINLRGESYDQAVHIPMECDVQLVRSTGRSWTMQPSYDKELERRKQLTDSEAAATAAAAAAPVKGKQSAAPATSALLSSAIAIFQQLESIDFGSVQCGERRQRVFKLRNESDEMFRFAINTPQPSLTGQTPATQPVVTDSKDKKKVPVVATAPATAESEASGDTGVWSFEPEFGHLLPSSSQLVTVSFIANQPIQHHELPALITLTKIKLKESLPESLNGDAWHSGSVHVRYLTDEEINREALAKQAAIEAEQALQRAEAAKQAELEAERLSAVSDGKGKKGAKPEKSPKKKLPGTAGQDTSAASSPAAPATAATGDDAQTTSEFGSAGGESQLLAITGLPSSTPGVLHRVIDPIPEPAYDPVDGPSSSLSLLLSACVDRPALKLALSSSTLAFAPTLMFATRVFRFDVTNTAAIRLDYDWIVRGSDNDSDQPFTIEPASGSIEAYDTITMTVQFTPSDAYENITSEASLLIDGVPSPLTTLSLTGSSIRPVCHFSLPAESYKPDASAVPASLVSLYDSLRVLSIQSVGVGQKTVCKFEVINPTNTDYSFKWQREEPAVTSAIAVEDGKLPDIDSPRQVKEFACVTSHGTLPAGSKKEMCFAYTPTSSQSSSVYYVFTIPALSLRVPLMVRGLVREPRVTVNELSVNHGVVRVGQSSKSLVVVTNHEDIVLPFITEMQCVSQSGDKLPVTVSHARGTLQPRQSLTLTLTFAPQQPHAINARLCLRFPKKQELLFVLVKGEGASEVRSLE